MDYWDTSALLNLYVPEHDSAYFLDLIAETKEPLISSAIATTEMLCALHHKERKGDIKPGGAKALFRRFRADCQMGRIALVPYGIDVAAEVEKLIDLGFGESRNAMVRSLCLIHLASASIAKAKRLVATDRTVRELASRLRFELLP